MTPTIFQIKPMDKASAFEIVKWRYDPPYDFYNFASDKSGDDVEVFLNPDNDYHAITDEKGKLLGYCCFGPDAQVPGGNYSEEALDIGLGMRPDMTGRGLGGNVTQTVLDFAKSRHPGRKYRATVAAFNKRAQRVCTKAGFQMSQSFLRAKDNHPFVVLTYELDDSFK